jgi:hypothetical protein
MAPRWRRIRLSDSHDPLRYVLYIAVIYGGLRRTLVGKIYDVLPSEKNGSHQRTCGIAACCVDLSYANIESKEQVTKTDIRTIGTADTSYLRHDMRIDNFDRYTIIAQVDTRSMSHRIGLVIHSMAKQ